MKSATLIGVMNWPRRGLAGAALGLWKRRVPALADIRAQAEYLG